MTSKHMVLACPDCGKLHIDAGETLKVFHSRHECLFCGKSWQPYDFCTVGVQPKNERSGCRADEIEPGGVFKKPKGELYYLRIGEFGLTHHFGPNRGNYGLGTYLGKYVFGVSYNGNMTALERNRPVIRGNLSDMMKNIEKQQDFEDVVKGLEVEFPVTVGDRMTVVMGGECFFETGAWAVYGDEIVCNNARSVSHSREGVDWARGWKTPAVQEMRAGRSAEHDDVDQLHFSTEFRR